METKQSTEPHDSKTPGNHATRARSATPAELRQALDEVASSVSELYEAADTFLGEQARERPHAVLGVAAAVGFVLGGGLASRIGGSLVSFGSRMLMTRLLDGWLSEAD